MPPNVKMFAFLLLTNKLLTHEVMMRRGFQCDEGCQTCQGGEVESLLHKLFQCPYAKRVWDCVASATGYQLMVQGEDVAEVWQASANRAKVLERGKKKQWAAKFICACWHIWKNRNAVIFREEHIPPQILAGRIIEEMVLWLKFC